MQIRIEDLFFRDLKPLSHKNMFEIFKKIGLVFLICTSAGSTYENKFQVILIVIAEFEGVK